MPGPFDTNLGLLDTIRSLSGRDRHTSGGERASPPEVSAAFALGWEMSVLFLEETPIGEQRKASVGRDRLPSLSRFSPTERSLVRLDQIRGISMRFHDAFEAAGVKPTPSTTSLEKLVNEEPSRNELRGSLADLHRSLLRALSAVNPRLAKAYRLGTSLANTCRCPSDEASLKLEFNRSRLDNLGEWLADLASLFPPHTSRAVRVSISAWRRWVDEPQLNPVEAERELHPSTGRLSRLKRAARAQATKSRTLDWEKEGPAVLGSLIRQGEVWRAVLSAEKQADAMLELPDYVEAAVQTLRRMVWLLRGVLFPLVVALVVFVAGFIVLFTTGSTGKLLAGVATVTGAIGFTWKGTLGAISRVSGDLEHPVWGAELDDRIARAITQPPPGTDFIWEEPKDAAPASGPPPGLREIANGQTG